MKLVVDASAAVHLVLRPEHSPLSSATIWKHSVYDLTYAALARRLGAGVVTLDRSFARLLRDMRIEVLTPFESP